MKIFEITTDLGTAWVEITKANFVERWFYDSMKGSKVMNGRYRRDRAAEAIQDLQYDFEILVQEMAAEYADTGPSMEDRREVS